MSRAEDKLERLKEILAGMQRVLIAFSGGVDSTFLLAVARDVLSGNVLAVTAKSEVQVSDELEEAAVFVSHLDVEHVMILTDELGDERFVSNPPDRCYHCKKKIFSEMVRMADERGIEWVLDGSNADDVRDYRPGMKATAELGVRSPLKEAGLTKQEIRVLSKKRKLPTWDKPALACLASRIPYGTRITTEKLRRIDDAESFLRREGLKQVRVRDHGVVARVEVAQEEMERFFVEVFARRVVRILKDLGYSYVALDLEGYRTGSLNETVVSHGQGTD